MDQKTTIWLYLLSNHVLSLSANFEEECWSASLFYAGDPDNNAVYIMTDPATQHGALMLKNPVITGTICDQNADVSSLKGIQFKAFAAITATNDAMALYLERFPVAKKMAGTLWKINFTVLKYTDNSLGFGTKLIWNKDEN